MQRGAIFCRCKDCFVKITSDLLFGQYSILSCHFTQCISIVDITHSICLTSRHHHFLSEAALFNQLCWSLLFSLTSNWNKVLPRCHDFQFYVSSACSLLSSPDSYNPPTYMSSLLQCIRYISKLTYPKLVLDLLQNMLSISNVLFLSKW